MSDETTTEQLAEIEAQVAFLKGREVTLGTRLQQEKQVTTRLREELATQAETIRKLQIELDAAQQVPQAIADRFEEGWNQGTARAVETIAEWLEPLRHLIDAADNVAETNLASNLASDTIQALPAIMRSLTGSTDED